MATYCRPTTFLALGAAAILVASCGSSVEDEIWAHRTRRPLLPGESQMFGPVLVGDKAIVCGGYGWAWDGRLAAVGVADGRSRWEHVVGWSCAPPMVVGDVAVGFGTQPDSLMIKAVDIDTGRLRWQRSVPRRFRGRRPLRHGAWVYLYDGAQTVLGLDTATGTYREMVVPGCDPKPKIRHGMWMWAAGDARRVVFGCGRAVYVLDADTTSPCLLTTLEERVGGPDEVALHGDVIYVAENTYASKRSGRARAGKLTAFDLPTGRKLWERRWKNVRTPEVVGDGLYAHIVDKKWEMIALDPHTGQDRWRADVRGFFSPLLRNGRLYVDDQGYGLPFEFRVAAPTHSRRGRGHARDRRRQDVRGHVGRSTLRDPSSGPRPRHSLKRRRSCYTWTFPTAPVAAR